MINSVYVNLLSFSTNPSFVVSTLQSIGAEPLLKFELEIRQWFERNIAARNAAFYLLEGVTDHVASYLSYLSFGIRSDIWTRTLTWSNVFAFQRHC